LLLLGQHKIREKRLNAVWKIYDSGRMKSDLSSRLFQRAFWRFARKDMLRKNEDLRFNQHSFFMSFGKPCWDKVNKDQKKADF